MIRQGDVLLVPVAVPRDAKLVEGDGKAVILALGEVTGHAHTLTARGLRVYEHEGTRYIRVANRGVLVHQEHGNIAVKEGEYRVVIQREYSPEAIRNVTD